MRTHKKHGVLLAGINGYKIYFVNNTYRIVTKGLARDVRESDQKIVTDFVNLKYQPTSEHSSITKNFLIFVGAL
jgi:hypothetical protein